jgi:hypothetical protein
MKKILFTLSLTAILFTGFSCRENNKQAKTPADTNKMEGVRESKEDAMEKEKERSGTDESYMEKDSVSKKDSTANKARDGSKN